MVQHRGGAGFSVLELLVSAGLLAVIMVGLLSMFYQTERAFRLGTGQADTLEGARSALELISRDFQELTPSYNSNAYHFAAILRNPAQLPPIEMAPGVPPLLYYFYFLRRFGDQLRGVRYDFLSQDLTNGVAALYRYEVRDFATNELDACEILLKHSPDVYPGDYGKIVDGVVNLTVTAFDAHGNQITNYISPNFSVYQYAFKGTNAPATVELELGILEPSALRKWRALSPANRDRFLRDNIAKVHLFRERIPIRSRQ